MLKKREGKIRLFSKRKSQASVEFIIILIVVLLIFIFIIGLNTNYLDQISGDYNTNLVKTAINDIYASANEVYKEGSGAQTEVVITLPNDITSSLISNNQMYYAFNINGFSNDYFKSFPFQVIGSLPKTQGSHTIEISAREGYVIINEKLLTVNPIFLTKTAALGNQSTAYIYFSSRYNTTLNISVSFSGDPELMMNISFPSSFLIPYGGNYTFPITFTLPSYSTNNKLFGLFKLNITNITSNESDLMNVDFVVSVMQTTLEYEIQNNAAFIYPTRWDTYLVPNQTTSQNFLICSGFPTLENYVVSFSSDQGGSWLSFSPFGTNRTSSISMNISSNQCGQFNVYEIAGTPFQGNYMGSLLSNSPDNTSLSSLVYTTVYADNTPPNITGFNYSFKYGIVNDTLCVYVNASDNVGVQNVWVLYQNPSGPQQYPLNLYQNSSCPNSTGWFANSVQLSIPGYYYINQTYATDFSGNLANVTDNVFVFSKQIVYVQTPIDAREEQIAAHHRILNATALQFNDGTFTSQQDDGDYLPDYSVFTWGNFSINNTENVSQIQFIYVYRDRFSDDGTISYDDPAQDQRHMVRCWKNNTWQFIQTYPLDTQPNWDTFKILDISQCINSPSDLDGFKMNITFDPADQAGGSFQDIDYVALKVTITKSQTPNLWINYSHTNSTDSFETALNGWNYLDNVYTTDNSTAPSLFNMYGNPNNFNGTKFANSSVLYTTGLNRLEVKMGIGSTQNITASGAWGINFNITNSMYTLLSGGAHMYYYFVYNAENLNRSAVEGCWIKTRFNGTYLGSDLDAHPPYFLHYSDSTPEVWTESDFEQWNFTMGSEDYDVTPFVTGPGIYSIDLGGRVDFRMGNHQKTQGCGVYFSNVKLLIITQ